MKTRRRITELLGDNNGRIVCRAVRTGDGWVCEETGIDFGIYMLENTCVRFRYEAELWMRDHGACRIIACRE